jgi:hypothetical protein
MLPLLQIVFDEFETNLGVLAVSAVNDPAIQERYIKLSNQKLNFSIQDEEQRIIFAPALIPGMKIYRNFEGQECEVTIDRDTVKKVAINYAKNNRLNNVNIEHKEIVAPNGESRPDIIEGVVLFESFLSDENRSTSIKNFEHLPMGTWFLSGKVYNDQVWEDVKSGKLNGWSIHSQFKMKQVENPETIDDRALQAAVKYILSKF